MPKYVDIENLDLRGLAVFDENLDVLIPLSDVRKALKMLPVADVVEVVRCKDCLYSYFNTSNETFSCQRTYPRRWVQEDDYCNYAKKEGVSEDATIY
jgi:hypothetical protein